MTSSERLGHAPPTGEWHVHAELLTCLTMNVAGKDFARPMQWFTANNRTESCLSALRMRNQPSACVCLSLLVRHLQKSLKFDAAARLTMGISSLHSCIKRTNNNAVLQFLMQQSAVIPSRKGSVNRPVPLLRGDCTRKRPVHTRKFCT